MEGSVGIGKTCDNCIFSTFGFSKSRPRLVCRQRVGYVGRFYLCEMSETCPNFYLSNAAKADNKDPRPVPLTQGKFAMVAVEKYGWVSHDRWFARKGYNTYYAVRKSGGKTIKMHREIMNAPADMMVDHIDHNGLNNRRENLRICTNSENSRNRRRTPGGSSRYKGVRWNKRKGKWAVSICYKRKERFGGYYDDEVEAGKAYDRRARELFGEFASPNFPETQEERSN